MIYVLFPVVLSTTKDTDERKFIELADQFKESKSEAFT